MVPVPSYRRPSSLIGISIVLVLLASAIDAVVWTYQTSRELGEIGTVDATEIPTLSHTDVAAIRARAREADVARAEEELRIIDQRVLERLRSLDEDQQPAPELDYFHPLDDSGLAVQACNPADPLCGLDERGHVRPAP